MLNGSFFAETILARSLAERPISPFNCTLSMNGPFGQFILLGVQWPRFRHWIGKKSIQADRGGFFVWTSLQSSSTQQDPNDHFRVFLSTRGGQTQAKASKSSQKSFKFRRDILHKITYAAGRKNKAMQQKIDFLLHNSSHAITRKAT